MFSQAAGRHTIDVARHKAGHTEKYYVHVVAENNILRQRTNKAFNWSLPCTSKANSNK